MAVSSNVLVFTRALLPQGETFIYDHVRSLTRYRPTLIGIRPAEHSLPLDGIDSRLLLDRPSRLNRLRFALLGQAPAFDKIMRELRPALIHVHHTTEALHLLKAASRYDVPLIVTAHGSDVSINPGRLPKLDRILYILRMKSLVDKVDRLICVSDVIREYALKRGFPPERCQTQYLGIPYRKFLRRDSTPIPGRVIFVGRLVEKKGAHHLIRAAKQVRDSGIPISLRIIGDGPMRLELQALAESLGVDAAFLGACGRAEISDELAQAWVFSMPGIRAANGDAEGLGLVYLEAQAAGVPVVAFEGGAAAEAVENGVTGLLAQEGNISDLASMLRILLVSPVLRARMARAAIKRIVTRFDLDANTTKLEAIYDEVIRAHAAQRHPRANAASAA